MSYGAKYFRNSRIYNDKLMIARNLPALEVVESLLIFPYVNERNITALW